MIIVIKGEPIPKMRHRHFSRGGFVSTYDPQIHETLQTKSKMRLEREDHPLKSSLKVNIIFHLGISKSHSTPKRNLTLWGLGKTQKPDLDNLAKFYLDAGNGVLWEDDAQITSLTLNKVYSNNPRTVIMIEQHKSCIDDDAKDVLSIISPEDFENIVGLLSHYHVHGKASENGSTTDNTFDRSVWASWAALVLSEIASKYSKQLSKIAKKHPDLWKSRTQNLCNQEK